ncbi:MAG: hypothetical protein IJ094_12880 [Bacilli bacterium]|nr:hypothetical protein [Bacilli bacterium]
MDYLSELDPNIEYNKLLSLTQKDIDDYIDCILDPIYYDDKKDVILQLISIENGDTLDI